MFETAFGITIEILSLYLEYLFEFCSNLQWISTTFEMERAILDQHKLLFNEPRSFHHANRAECTHMCTIYIPT